MEVFKGKKMPFIIKRNYLSSKTVSLMDTINNKNTYLMSKFEKIIENRIAQNIFIWFCLFIIFIGSAQGGNRALISLSILGVLAPAVYINNLVIFPILKKSKPLFYFLFVLNILVFNVVSLFIINFSTKETITLRQFFNFSGMMLLTVSFGLALKLARDSFSQKQKDKEAELKLLKAQLNPHFLFNTLNNLYGLAVLKSDKLPNLMLKLSDLLRYSLYDTKEKFVPLAKEISYLENYVSLEKIRLEDKATINLHKKGDFTNHTIAPMLLIVFVENAFKHLNKDGKSQVDISLEIINNELHFICENTFDKNEVSKTQLETNKSGIGLQNAKKRLNLIYADKHQLDISQNEDIYKVSLILNYQS